MKRELVHPDDAIAIIQSALVKPECEVVPLARALGRVLPYELRSSIDQPPFDKAAMDGWAWKRDGLSWIPQQKLRACGSVAAGADSAQTVGFGECVRVMTGASVPKGADCIQRFEWSEEESGLVTFTKAEHEDNIIQRGANVRAADILLHPGVLKAQDIAILAADGQASLSVSICPRVGVLSTGTELSEPGQKLSGSNIYDSNRPQIIAQLASMPCFVLDLGSVQDNFDATVKLIQSAMSTVDVLVLSGGVSMGDFDYVPKALATLGVEALFHGVAMKPGKPTWYGRKGNFHVLGLPGNPVSVFVNTELLLKPLIFALSGIIQSDSLIPVPVTQTIERTNSDRVEFLPVSIASDGATAVPYSGSSAIQALANANGFLRLEIGQKSIQKGELAYVRLVR